MRQRLPTMAYRVEIVVCCPRGHKLLPFHRITVPELDDGVAYEANKRGRFSRLSGTDYRGREWHRIHLRCDTPLPTGQRCQAHVEINRDRVERKLANMWAPMTRRVERVVWDEQSD